MAASSNNIVTADAYPGVSAGCKNALTGSVKMTVTVVNAAVMMQRTFRDVDGTATAGPDEFLAPGVYSYVAPINSVQWKAAVAGIQGRVTSVMLLLSEAG